MFTTKDPLNRVRCPTRRSSHPPKRETLSPCGNEVIRTVLVWSWRVIQIPVLSFHVPSALKRNNLLKGGYQGVQTESDLIPYRSKEVVEFGSDSDISYFQR